MPKSDTDSCVRVHARAHTRTRTRTHAQTHARARTHGGKCLSASAERTEPEAARAALGDRAAAPAAPLPRSLLPGVLLGVSSRATTLGDSARRGLRVLSAGEPRGARQAGVAFVGAPRRRSDSPGRRPFPPRSPPGGLHSAAPTIQGGGRGELQGLSAPSEIPHMSPASGRLT